MSNNFDNSISVIVPVYNVEPYIVRCAESLLVQTFAQIELIMVDDGSGDLSGVRLDELAAQNDNIQVVHIPNGGVMKARLTGVSLSNGNYIGFCDGDDYLDPNMFERLMSNMVEHHADISHCGYQMVFPDRIDYYYNTGFKAVWDRNTALLELLSGKRVEPGLWNKLYKKQLFYIASIFDKLDLSIKINEDLLANYYLFKAADCVVYEDFCPYHYMIRKGSAATGLQSPHKLYDPIRVQKTLLKETEEQPELQRIIYSRLAAIYSGSAEMNPGTQPELINPYRKMCRRELLKILPTVLFRTDGKATKIHALLAALCPNLCRTVHKMYSIKRGTYGLYDVD